MQSEPPINLHPLLSSYVHTDVGMSPSLLAAGGVKISFSKNFSGRSTSEPCKKKSIH